MKKEKDITTTTGERKKMRWKLFGTVVSASIKSGNKSLRKSFSFFT
jgi:hypothetical protein